MAKLIDLIVSGKSSFANDISAKNIYADKFIRTGSTDSYVLLGGGGHKLLSDFSMAHSHPYLPTTQVLQEQASNDDWIRTHALSTLRGHVYNVHNVEWQYLFGISTGKTYGSILRTSYGNGTPRIQVMGLTNGAWSSWREVAYDDNTVKKDGTGASGTWGISITGNSGYASSAGNADTVDGKHASAFATAGHTHSYLPLSGGTMTLGEGLKFHSDENYFGTNLDARIISLLDSNGTTCDGGLIIDERATSNGVETITELLRIRHDQFTWKGNKIWHAGNDGSGSGLDADLLDGYHASSFYKIKSLRSDVDSIYDLRWNCGNYDKGDYNGTYKDEYPTAYGSYLALTYNDRDIGALMFFDTPPSNVLGHIYVRTRGAGNNTTYSEWGTLAYLTDNVASATYATSAGNADSVDGQHFSYSNDSNSPTYLWATNSNGSSFLAARANISVKYANSAGSADSVAWANITGKPSTFPVATHNHDDKYVKLNGTSVMTGDLTLSLGDVDRFIVFSYNGTTNPASNSWRTGVLGSGSDEANYYVVQYQRINTSSSSWRTSFKIGQDTGNVTFTNNITIGDKVNYYAGNLTPKTITLSTSAQTYITANGTNYTLKLPSSDPYTSARTPTAHTHYATTFKDSRNEAMTPAQGANVNGIAIDFKTKANGVGAGSGSYCGLVTFDPYADVSGGYPMQMGFNSGPDTNNTNEVYIRTAKDSTTWNTWRTIINDANYTNYVNTTNFPGLNKVGTVTSVTVTGANGLSGSGTVTSSGTITLSNAGVRSATINGNYLRVNTNGTNADLTIPYATYASSSPAAANYGGRGDTTKIKIKINSAASWMLSFVVTIYQGYKSSKVMVSGYNYGSNYWYEPEAVLLGDSNKATSISVYFGYDSVWNLWVGFDGGSYTGVSISDVTNGYTQISSYKGLFTISNVSSLSTLQTTITATNSVNYAVSAGNADTVDSQHFNWNNNKNDHTYLWAASSNGQAYLVHRASMSVNYANSAGSASSATIASTVTVNSSDANSTYRMVWHSGNTLYGTGGIYCNPSTDTLYASAFYESSDIRLKQNIKQVLTSNDIPQIKEFDWKNTGKHSYGLIAQELESMGYSELVDTKDDGYKSVNYTAALCLIIGKLQLKIKELEDKIKSSSI